MKTRGERLRAAREAAGYKTGADAARALGMKQPTYNNHERAGTPGSRDYGPDEAAKYARKFRVEDTWLLTGKGQGPRKLSDDADFADKVAHRAGHIDSSEIALGAGDFGSSVQSKRMSRVVGYVGAGSEAHYYALADDEFEEVEAWPGSSDKAVAVEIRGKSFGPLMDGWIVHYEDVRSPITDDMLNKTCVVGLADDRILLKKVRQENDGSFTLLSNSNEEPIRDAIIEWAAMVIGFKPR